MNVSLRDLATKWRGGDEQTLISRHEYDSSTDLFSQTGNTIEVGPVGPVGPPRNINNLNDESRTHLSGSTGGSTAPSGELTSWHAEGDSYLSPATSPWGFTEAEREAALDRLRLDSKKPNEFNQLPSEKMVVSPGMTAEHKRQSSVCEQDRPLPDLPAIPSEWIAGVYRLRTMRAPCDIDERRWDRFQYDALRILHEHGALLHAAGWDDVDVFGLHRLAPDRRTDGMGLAWLAKKAVVATIDADAVSIGTNDGTMQRVFKLKGQGRTVAVAAWDLGVRGC